MLNHGLLPHRPHSLSVSGAGPQKSISHTAAISILWAIKTKELSPLFIKTSSLLSHQLCAILRSLSTLLVVRAKLSSASFSSTSKLLERLIHAHSTHSLNIPKFFNTSSSGCSPATWVTWLLWNSSGSCNLPHLRTFPRPSCGTCSFGFFGSDSWPAPPCLFSLILTSKCWNPQASFLGPLLFLLPSGRSHPLSLACKLLFCRWETNTSLPQSPSFCLHSTGCLLNILNSTSPKPNTTFGSQSLL